MFYASYPKVYRLIKKKLNGKPEGYIFLNPKKVYIKPKFITVPPKMLWLMFGLG